MLLSDSPAGRNSDIKHPVCTWFICKHRFVSIFIVLEIIFLFLEWSSLFTRLAFFERVGCYSDPFVRFHIHGKSRVNFTICGGHSFASAFFRECFEWQTEEDALCTKKHLFWKYCVILSKLPFTVWYKAFPPCFRAHADYIQLIRDCGDF